MRINYNVSSIIARNALNNNDTRLSNSIQRLSSGLKINSAEDDSAGLAISIKMNAQIKCLERATQNANDGISVVNTADGAMSEMHDILQRMNELAIQSANGTNADSDREQIQLEIDQLVAELDRIAETTEFNGQKLLDGSFAYKGFTNTENVKVMSYSDGVQSGVYAIESITYSKYEDKIMDFEAYVNGDKTNGNISHETSYEIGNADSVLDGLYGTANIAGNTISENLRAFPDGSKVLIEDENIVIKGENDFEVKLAVNDNKTVTSTTLSATKLTTTATASKTLVMDSYRNITVKNEDGSSKYNIDELNIVEKNGNREVVLSAVDKENLKADLSDEFDRKFPNAVSTSITNCSYAINNGIGEITVEVECTDTNNTTTISKIKLAVELNYTISVQEDVTDQNGNIQKVTKQKEVDFSDADNRIKYKDQYDKLKLSDKIVDATNGDPLNKYLYTHTERTETEYTVGENGKPIVLDLTGIGAMRIQVGANEGQVIEMEIPALQSLYLGVDDLDISTEEKATAAIDTIGDAINQLSGIRAKIGAYANRIEHTITNLDSTVENMTAAYSRIMDVDMAKEMTEYSTVQVLVQSSTAMLAQANERPQQALQLLQ